MTNSKMEIEEYLYFNGLGLESHKIEEIAIALDNYEDGDTRDGELICLVRSAVEEEERELENLRSDY